MPPRMLPDREWSIAPRAAASVPWSAPPAPRPRLQRLVDQVAEQLRLLNTPMGGMHRISEVHIVERARNIVAGLVGELAEDGDDR